MSDATRGAISVSSTSTAVNRTGSWKYIRPVYHDRVAPCNAGCPVGTDIEGYMVLLRDGHLEQACELLMRENPMPAVTGRVCHHPCESSCNRRHLDSAVAIHAVERMLGDYALQMTLPPPPRAHRESVAIVGSGPAGLACAYHLVRLGYTVKVYEEMEEPGGMLRKGIPPYRLPRDVLDRQVEQLRELGVQIRCGVRIGKDVGWGALLNGFDALFIATGAHVSRALGVEGEDLHGVWKGLEFLRWVNEGARPDIGRRVVVVGGGNTAMDCARTALRLGARPVVVYRRTREEMPAIPQEVEEAEREGVEFVFLATPAAFRGSFGKVTGVQCTRMRLGEPDASGRRRPIPTDEEPFSIVADTVLTATGEDAELDVLPDAVDFGASSIVVDEWGATRVPIVFAGGDVAGDERTVANALGAGKRAALAIDGMFRKHRHEAVPAERIEELRFGPAGNVSATRWRQDDPLRRVSPLNEVVQLDDMNFNHFERVARSEDRQHVVGSDHVFAEVNLGLEPPAALQEAYRCCNCGVCNECELCVLFCADAAIKRGSNGARFEIDLDHCKGCGVCAAECPRGAISMTREAL